MPHNPLLQTHVLPHWGVHLRLWETRLVVDAIVCMDTSWCRCASTHAQSMLTYHPGLRPYPLQGGLCSILSRGGSGRHTCLDRCCSEQHKGLEARMLRVYNQSVTQVFMHQVLPLALRPRVSDTALHRLICVTELSTSTVTHSHHQVNCDTHSACPHSAPTVPPLRCCLTVPCATRTSERWTAKCLQRRM